MWRDGLWYKLLKSGITGKLYTLVKNMYTNIKSCVLVNQETSEFFVSQRGVRQGENLSPLLFALYVNDLEDNSLGENCAHLKSDDEWLDLYLKLLVLMYADDTVIMGDSEEGIKNALKALDNYCHQWKLEVNCSKTKVVVFGRGRIVTENFQFVYRDDSVETVREYKYLGMLFNSNGRFRRGQQECIEAATRAM